MNDHPQCVTLYPELSAAAIKAGKHRELALWHELRAINDWGSGVVGLDYTMPILLSGYQPRTLDAILKAGNGEFWDVALSRRKRSERVQVGRARIQISGLEKVCRYFNIQYVTRPVKVPVVDFIKDRRGCLYSSFFKPDGCKCNPLWRGTITQATGLDKRTQRRYEKRLGIHRVANTAVWRNAEGRVVPLLKEVAGKCRVWLKPRRLGNIYHSPVLKTPKGMTRKINRKLNTEVREATGKRSSRNLGEAQFQRRFFRTGKHYMRTKNRAEEPFILVESRERLIKGRVEWCIM